MAKKIDMISFAGYKLIALILLFFYWAFSFLGFFLNFKFFTYVACLDGFLFFIISVVLLFLDTNSFSPKDGGK